MKPRSIRLFNVRILFGVEVTTTKRYAIQHQPLSHQSDLNFPTQYADDSLALLLKALPEVAKEIAKKYQADSRCVIVDLDNGAEELYSNIGFLVESEVIREQYASVSEIVKLK